MTNEAKALLVQINENESHLLSFAVKGCRTRTPSLEQRSEVIVQLVGCVVQHWRKLNETIVAKISFIKDATPFGHL